MPLASEASSPIDALGDTSPALVLNEAAANRLVFCCDHAGAEIPQRLNDLDLSEEDRNDHIGIDIGIFATTCWIAGTLRAPVVAQPISRLVIDCNRKPESADSIRRTYDGRNIPGNANIDDTERGRRVSEILNPYQRALADVLAKAKRGTDLPPILVSMHSFARSYGGERRACDIGVIFEEPQDFAMDLLKNLQRQTGLRVMHNEPYKIDFKDDYTIPFHSVALDVPYVEIEICQDLISTCKGQRDIARHFLAAFEQSQGAVAVA